MNCMKLKNKKRRAMEKHYREADKIIQEVIADNLRTFNSDEWATIAAEQDPRILADMIARSQAGVAKEDARMRFAAQHLSKLPKLKPKVTPGIYEQVERELRLEELQCT